METKRRLGEQGTFLMRLVPPVKFVLIAAVFSLSHAFHPLFSSNQNTYFLHGIVKAGMDSLSRDWLAATADPFPVFSYLVTFTCMYLPQVFFHVYYILITGVYVYAIAGIVSEVWDIGSSAKKFYIWLIVILGMHSAALCILTSGRTGGDYRYLLTSGVANQHLLGSVFQPSVFGVFLILSIYLFLRKRPLWAVVCSGIAVTFHSTYLISAAILTVSYVIIILWRERSIAKAFLVSLTSLVTVLPILVYVYTTFGPTTPESSDLARSILVDCRIPHHAKISAWFGRAAVIQILIIASALLLVRKKKVIFTILLTASVAGVFLTLAQHFTGNDFLALLFPWRISTILVPVSSCLIAGFVVSAFYNFTQNWLHRHTVLVGATVLSLAALFVAVGTVTSCENLAESESDACKPVMEFVANTRGPTDTYLIPPGLEKFRLCTGAPIFVDYKSHPYRDIEVIEWWDRLQLAERYYAAPGDSAGTIMQIISRRYPVTHVVEPGDLPHTDLGLRTKLYQDSAYSVFRVTSPNSHHN